MIRKSFVNLRLSLIVVSLALLSLFLSYGLVLADTNQLVDFKISQNRAGKVAKIADSFKVEFGSPSGVNLVTTSEGNRVAKYKSVAQTVDCGDISWEQEPFLAYRIVNQSESSTNIVASSGKTTLNSVQLSRLDTTKTKVCFAIKHDRGTSSDSTDDLWQAASTDYDIVSPSPVVVQISPVGSAAVSFSGNFPGGLSTETGLVSSYYQLSDQSIDNCLSKSGTDLDTDLQGNLWNRISIASSQFQINVSQENLATNSVVCLITIDGIGNKKLTAKKIDSSPPAPLLSQPLVTANGADGLVLIRAVDDYSILVDYSINKVGEINKLDQCRTIDDSQYVAVSEPKQELNSSGQYELSHRLDLRQVEVGTLLGLDPNTAQDYGICLRIKDQFGFTTFAYQALENYQSATISLGDRTDDTLDLRVEANGGTVNWYLWRSNSQANCNSDLTNQTNRSDLTGAVIKPRLGLAENSQADFVGTGVYFCVAAEVVVDQSRQTYHIPDGVNFQKESPVGLGLDISQNGNRVTIASDSNQVQSIKYFIAADEASFNCDDSYDWSAAKDHSNNLTISVTLTDVDKLICARVVNQDDQSTFQYKKIDQFWDELTDSQKIRLNPYDCDLDNQFLLSSDGSCRDKLVVEDNSAEGNQEILNQTETETETDDEEAVEGDSKKATVEQPSQSADDQGKKAKTQKRDNTRVTLVAAAIFILIAGAVLVLSGGNKEERH